MFLKNTSIYLLAILSLITSGCMNTATYPTRDATQLNQINSNQRYIVDEPLGIQRSHSTVGRFNSQMIFMADQIERNADRKSLDNTFVVTSFSNLNKLSETTAFGRLVGENLMHELQVRKWKVFEVRMTKDIIMNENGEFSLSRDIQKIRDTYKVGGVVTGTYSISDNNVMVNARVVDINSGIVTSSGQIIMPINWFTESLLSNSDGVKPMKIVGDVTIK